MPARPGASLKSGAILAKCSVLSYSAGTMAERKGQAQTLTLEQVDDLIATMTAFVNGSSQREESRAYRQKLSKRARIDELERETEVLQAMVYTLMVEKLIALREQLRKGEETKGAFEFLAACLRLTTLKTGKG